jgi:hypothetical protein
MSSVTGGINTFTATRGKVDDVEDVDSYFFVSGKSLTRNHAPLTRLMRETLEQPRFDEHTRIKELIGQQRAHREQSVTGQGHSLAMLAASSGLNAVAALKHKLNGLEGIQHIKQLDAQLTESNGIKELAEKFQAIHDAIVEMDRQFLIIGESEHLNDYLEDLAKEWADAAPAQQGNESFSLSATTQQVKQLWIANSPINYCAKAYPTVPIEHDDAAALSVLAGFLRNGYLHTAIREKGGAYGGGASFTSDTAVFRFYSYRDPRLVDTLKDFDQSIEWLLSEKHDKQKLEEAILGVIGNIDKPSSPAGEAKDAFQNSLFGRTPEKRQYYRGRILKVTMDDLKRVAETYFQPEQASTAVITNAATLDKLGDMGMEVKKL